LKQAYECWQNRPDCYLFVSVRVLEVEVHPPLANPQKGCNTELIFG